MEIPDRVPMGDREAVRHRGDSRSTRLRGSSTSAGELPERSDPIARPAFRKLRIRCLWSWSSALAREEARLPRCLASVISLALPFPPSLSLSLPLFLSFSLSRIPRETRSSIPLPLFVFASDANRVNRVHPRFNARGIGSIGFTEERLARDALVPDCDPIATR